MFGFGSKKTPLEPYKGVRDFYPEDSSVQEYIFSTWKKTAEMYGYQKYNASILEPLDLYRAKSSEEIVNEQIYSFKDRGDREVALRPEMTPTVARMIAAKYREYPAPIRWYSMPNLFRYEKPQRGRLREHWQLNVDLFGVSGPVADAEIVSTAHTMMKNFGATDSQFEIRINSREILNDLYASFNIEESKRQILSRIIDKKDKLPADAFKNTLADQVSRNTAEELVLLLNSPSEILEKLKDKDSAKNLDKAISLVWNKGIKNIVFSPSLARGFDYYTGVIFEFFDTDKENPRSILGGGRYDKLVGNFGGESIPAVGFGCGDVVIEDFLRTHSLLPVLKPSIDVWVAVVPETDLGKANQVADKLRESGLKVGLDIGGRKLDDQLKNLNKRNASYVIVVGSKEIESGTFVLRNTETREEKSGTIEEIAPCVK